MVDVVEGFELSAGLQAEDNAEASLLACVGEVGDVADAHEPLRVLLDECVPLSKQALRIREVAGTVAKVDDVDARTFEA